MRQGIVRQTPYAPVARKTTVKAKAEQTAPTRAAEEFAFQEAWSAAAATYADTAAPLTSQTGPALLAAARLRSRSEFLDLGCGVGALAASAQIFGALATGVDLAPGMIAAADAAPGRRGAAFRIGDARALDAREGSFDAVAANFSVLESGAPGVVLSEAQRALRVGGALAWTLWPGPSGGRLFELVAEAREKAFGARPKSFGATRDEALALMDEAGFVEVNAVAMTLVIDARAETMLAAVEALDAPAGALEGEKRRMTLEALAELLGDGGVLETEALLVTGSKPDPEAAPAHTVSEEPMEKIEPIEATVAAPKPAPALADIKALLAQAGPVTLPEETAPAPEPQEIAASGAEHEPITFVAPEIDAEAETAAAPEPEPEVEVDPDPLAIPTPESEDEFDWEAPAPSERSVSTILVPPPLPISASAPEPARDESDESLSAEEAAAPTLEEPEPEPAPEDTGVILLGDASTAAPVPAPKAEAEEQAQTAPRSQPEPAADPSKRQRGGFLGVVGRRLSRRGEQESE